MLLLKLLGTFMKQIFILLLLLSPFLHADTYPKLFAQLGTPLYKADEVFEKFASFKNVREKAEPYHEHVYELLELANKIEKAKKPDKHDKKRYINGLRTLQKEHDGVMREINTYLLQSIDSNDYTEFTRIINIGLEPILQNKIILKRSMAYYATYRTRGKIPVLDYHYVTLESDPDLFKYVKGHMPRVFPVTQTYHFGGVSHQLTLSNNEKFAFVADGNHCFKSLDIKNFNHASEVASYDFSGTGCELIDVKASSSGNYLYLSDIKNGFTVLDISQPKRPIQKDEYSKVRATTSVTTSDDITSFIVKEGTGLIVLDIYNKDEFRLLANYNKGAKINHLALDENRSILYLAHDEGLSILDVSTLGNPRKVYDFPVKNGVNHIALSPDKQKAYIASGDDGVHVLDLSKELEISLISTCLTPKYAYHLNLSKDGKKLFVSALNDGVYLIDTTDEKDMKHVSSFKSKKKKASALSSMLNKAEDTLFISFSKAGISKIKL